MARRLLQPHRVRWPWLLLVACSDAPTEPLLEVASFPATEVRELDLIFQIDDSGGTAHLHTDLSLALGSLLTMTRDVELHIGVISSDLGTLGSLYPEQPGEPIGTVGQGGCAGVGDGGAFLTSGAPVNGSFVVHGATRNYGGALEQVLRQMLSLGSSGCGFEQPLAATRRAIHVNDGFLRTDASLAIIMLADEDDCSVRDPAVFTTSVDELGPLTSFRCTREGVVCDEPLDVAGPKSNCRPRTDSRYIEDPELTRAELAFLKPQERLSVSAIVGEPAPFEVETRQIQDATQISLAHSCGWQTPTGLLVADPPVRIASFVRSFASRGNLQAHCDSDYRDELSQIAMTIQRSLGVACIDPTGLDLASCTAHDVLDRTERELPRCPAAGDCFDIVAGDPACTAMRVVVDRKSPPASRTRVDVFCRLLAEGSGESRK